MKCSKCGADNEDGVSVCKKCGEKLEPEADTALKPAGKRGKRSVIIGMAAALVVIAIGAVLLFTPNTAPSDTALKNEATAPAKTTPVAGNTVPTKTAPAPADTAPADTAPADGGTEPVFGNTPINSQNGGLAVEDGGWIYYCNSSDFYSLYKIRTDGTEKTKLTRNGADYINVAGGWVYYRDMSGGGSIYRMRTDGTDVEIINKGANSQQLIVYGDWIYYICRDQKDTYLYRVRTDGTQVSGFQVRSVYFSIMDGWIYYLDRSDSNGYKMRLDGSEKTRLDADYSKAAFMDGWIYYLDKDRPARVHADGTGREILTEDGARFFNVADGWVYYTNKEDGESIYKIRMDGTERTKLSEADCCLLINIAGDWVYYDVASQFYRMRTDGSENQRLE